jgi:hypothetical protein
VSGLNWVAKYVKNVLDLGEFGKKLEKKKCKIKDEYGRVVSILAYK